MKKNIFIILLGALSFGCNEESVIVGCTDELAYNFNADAQVDNGGCQYIEGCTDPAALNYNEYAMIMDGSCLYEGEGGEETDDYPNDPCEGLNVLTYHGHDYPLVAVGSQCWMKENLQSTRNNVGMAFLLDSINGKSEPVGNIVCYENDSSAIDLRGVLYRALDSVTNKACPVGWRPSNFTDIEIMSSETNVEIGALGHRLKASEPLWDGVDQFGLSFVESGGAVWHQFNTDDRARYYNTNSSGYIIYENYTTVNSLYEIENTVNQYYPIRCIKE